MPTFPTLFSIILEITNKEICPEKEKEGMEIAKRSQIVSICKWHDLIFSHSLRCHQNLLDSLKHF